MKELTKDQMANFSGGSWREILICAGLGAMYSIANPILGIAIGIACSAKAEYDATGKILW
jgi:hypothetical protein